MFFIPALVALTAIVLGRERRLVPVELAAMPRTTALVGLPVVFYGLYVVAGALTRLVALYEPRPGVRLGAAVALLGTGLLYLTWPKLPKGSGRASVEPGGGAARRGAGVRRSAGTVRAMGEGPYLQELSGLGRARHRAAAGNTRARQARQRARARERIKPIFVGRGFGNYDDRLQRDDVRYILTYVAPYIGYEGPVIQDVLEAYPDRAIIRTFDVAESATGHDRAALIDKFGDTFGGTSGTGAERVPAAAPARPGPTSRAQH